MYMALFPNQEDNLLNQAFFNNCPNRLGDLLPRASSYNHIIRVVDAADLPKGCVLRSNANTLKQRALCYLDRRGNTRRA
jgi:hypothetical protein